MHVLQPKVGSQREWRAARSSHGYVFVLDAAAVHACPGARAISFRLGPTGLHPDGAFNVPKGNTSVAGDAIPASGHCQGSGRAPDRGASCYEEMSSGSRIGCPGTLDLPAKGLPAGSIRGRLRAGPDRTARAVQKGSRPAAFYGRIAGCEVCRSTPRPRCTPCLEINMLHSRCAATTCRGVLAGQLLSRRAMPPVFFGRPSVTVQVAPHIRIAGCSSGYGAAAMAQPFRECAASVS